MEFPKMARTSSSFLALPVTKVTGRDIIKADALAAAAILPRFLFLLFGFDKEEKDNCGWVRHGRPKPKGL
jgi:hypothetical protein